MPRNILDEINKAILICLFNLLEGLAESFITVLYAYPARNGLGRVLSPK